MTLCQCEHAVHETPNEAIHPYLGTDAGDHRAILVGPICDDCAGTHLADYLDDDRTPGSGKSVLPQLRQYFGAREPKGAK